MLKAWFLVLGLWMGMSIAQANEQEKYQPLQNIESQKLVIVKFRKDLDYVQRTQHIIKLKSLDGANTRVLELGGRTVFAADDFDTYILSSDDIKVKIQLLIPVDDIVAIDFFDPRTINFEPTQRASALQIFSLFDGLLQPDVSPAKLAEYIVTVDQNIQALSHLHEDQKRKLIRGLNKALIRINHIYTLNQYFIIGEIGVQIYQHSVDTNTLYSFADTSISLVFTHPLYDEVLLPLWRLGRMVTRSIDKLQSNPCADILR